MKAANYDSPWKNILNYFLPAFMDFCLPHVAAAIDWSKGYVSLDKELHAISRRQKAGKRTVDTLFKVWLKSGEEVWLLLHIEVQAHKDVLFPERMYIYNYRSFDRYQKPIVSVAILADGDPNWRPCCYERSSLANKLYFEFATVKLLDYAIRKQDLSQESNPFAIVIWAHLEALQTRKQPQQRLFSKLAVTRALYKHGFSKDYILHLFAFIDWVLVLPEPLELEYEHNIEQLEGEKNVTYITSIERIGMKRGWLKGWEEGWQQGQQQGRQEGQQDGEIKGERALLTRQLQHRFGELPAQYKKRLDKAKSDQLLEWGERLLDAKVLKEVFGR